MDVQINPEDIGSYTDAEALERAKSKRYRPGNYLWKVVSCEPRVADKAIEPYIKLGDYSLAFGLAALTDRQDISSVHWLGKRGGVTHWLTLPVRNAKVEGHMAPEEEFRAHRFLRALTGDAILPAWPKVSDASVFFIGEVYPLSEYETLKAKANKLVAQKCGELLCGNYKNLVDCCVVAELSYKASKGNGREYPRLKEFFHPEDPRVGAISFVQPDFFVDE